MILVFLCQHLGGLQFGDLKGYQIICYWPSRREVVDTHEDGLYFKQESPLSELLVPAQACKDDQVLQLILYLRPCNPLLPRP